MESLNILKLKNSKKRLTGLFILGVSSIGISFILAYKYWKLKKFVIELEKRVKELASKVDENENRMARDFFRPSRSSLRSVSRCSESNYETPSTSPERPVFIIKNYQDENYDDLKIMFFQKENSDPTNFDETIDFLKLCYALSEKESDFEIRKKVQLKAYDIAKSCLQSYPDNYLSHKWYAIFTGKVVEYCGINDKVKNGFEFKKHLDIAIEMDQNDSVLYYLRGRWNYKMSKLNWAESYAIKLLFGKIPKITLDDALEDFLKAEDLHPLKSKSNLLFLSRCFIEKRDFDTAIKYLNIASKIKPKSKEEEKDEKEIVEMTKKYF